MKFNVHTALFHLIVAITFALRREFAEASTRGEFTTHKTRYDDYLHQQAIKQEFMKKILDGLGMKERPPRIPPENRKINIPRPVIDGGIDASSSKMPDEEAKRTEMVIASEEANDLTCKDTENCFRFNLNHAFLKDKIIEYAEIHIHKDATKDEGFREFLIEEIGEEQQRGPSVKSDGTVHREKKEGNDGEEKKGEGISKPGIRQSKKMFLPSSGWFRVPFKDFIKKWVDDESSQSIVHALRFSCKGLKICRKARYRPFLMLKVEEQKLAKGRKKRFARRCVPGYDKCCMRKLFVTFKEMNWNDWVIEPSGYWVNYCEGRCTGVGTMPSYSHAFVKEKLMKLSLYTKKSLDICCIPLKFDKLTLLHFDGEGVIHKTELPNMAVLECGCV